MQQVKPSMLSLVLILISFASGAPSRAGLPENSKLVLVNVLYRHGDRNPKSPYPKSEFRDLSDWPEGWGELTHEGIQQHYRFGRSMKLTYGPLGYGLLPDKCYIQDYKVLTTDVTRTIMSAMANNAGFCPPLPGEGIREPDIQWIPYPLTTMPVDASDTVFGQYCPLADSLVDNNRDKRFKDLMDENYELFAYADRNSGYDILNHPVRISWLYDTLLVESINKGKIPEWAKSIFPDPLRSYVMEYFKEGAKTQQIQRLTAGPTLKTIIKTMLNNTRGKDSTKMFAYSAHETNIYNILAALGKPLKKSPGYTAALFFELFKSEKMYYVRLLYRPGPDQSAVPVLLPGCNNQMVCTLTEFIKATANVLPVDLEKECRIKG